MSNAVSPPITHAYVRYEEDRALSIVRISDIKSFKPKDPEDFCERSSYMVKWSDGDDDGDLYYRARILVLGCK